MFTNRKSQLVLLAFVALAIIVGMVTVLRRGGFDIRKKASVINGSQLLFRGPREVGIGEKFTVDIMLDTTTDPMYTISGVDAVFRYQTTPSRTVPTCVFRDCPSYAIDANFCSNGSLIYREPVDPCECAPPPTCVENIESVDRKYVGMTFEEYQVMNTSREIEKTSYYRGIQLVSVIPGKTFDNYPVYPGIQTTSGTVEEFTGAGLPMTVSGVKNYSVNDNGYFNGFTGSGVFATLVFIAGAPGDATITLDYKGATATDDTNINGFLASQAVSIQKSKDRLLTAPQGFSIKVQSPKTPTIASVTTTPSSVNPTPPSGCSYLYECDREPCTPILLCPTSLLTPTSIVATTVLPTTKVCKSSGQTCNGNTDCCSSICTDGTEYVHEQGCSYLHQPCLILFSGAANGYCVDAGWQGQQASLGSCENVAGIDCREDGGDCRCSGPIVPLFCRSRNYCGEPNGNKSCSSACTPNNHPYCVVKAKTCKGGPPQGTLPPLPTTITTRTPLTPIPTNTPRPSPTLLPKVTLNVNLQMPERTNKVTPVRIFASIQQKPTYVLGESVQAASFGDFKGTGTIMPEPTISNQPGNLYLLGQGVTDDKGNAYIIVTGKLPAVPVTEPIKTAVALYAQTPSHLIRMGRISPDCGDGQSCAQVFFSDLDYSVLMRPTATTIFWVSYSDMIAGDVAIAEGMDRQDGIINNFDIAELLGQWGSTTATSADLNNDGVVNNRDYAILLSNFGKQGDLRSQ